VGINGRPINENREAHLYDAIRVSRLRYLAGEVGRKAVGDSRSESSMEEALESLLENDVIAYVVEDFLQGLFRITVVSHVPADEVAQTHPLSPDGVVNPPALFHVRRIHL
jgi:hypothetical protein